MAFCKYFIYYSHEQAITKGRKFIGLETYLIQYKEARGVQSTVVWMYSFRKEYEDAAQAIGILHA